MSKITQMFSNLRSTVNSMDRKNKAILGVVTIAVIGAMTFAGYSLTTIGKSVDDKVKQTETVSKKDKKGTSDTKKKDDKNVDQKGKEEGKKKESSKTDKKGKSDKASSTKENKTSTSTDKTSSSNPKTSNKSDTNGSTSNKAASSNESGNSSSSSSSSSSNTQQATKPKPKPTPAPQPTEPTEEELEAINKAAQQQAIDNARANSDYFVEGSEGAFEKVMAWAEQQKHNENSPYYGRAYSAYEVFSGELLGAAVNFCPEGANYC